MMTSLTGGRRDGGPLAAWQAGTEVFVQVSSSYVESHRHLPEEHGRQLYPLHAEGARLN